MQRNHVPQAAFGGGLGAVLTALNVGIHESALGPEGMKRLIVRDNDPSIVDPRSDTPIAGRDEDSIGPVSAMKEIARQFPQEYQDIVL